MAGAAGKRWAVSARRRSPLFAVSIGLPLLAGAAHAAQTRQPLAARDLASLSIEELSDIKVSSVSKRDEPLSGAAAAIYVITHDDIVRSGAVSLPEMLRLAPNLQVAQITASRYAISARGFNGSAADKLLVLVDGRSVYTPFSSTVNWNLQEVPGETIDRIEVISGPAGTLWGANAVNGVINIITRASGETQGLVLSGAAGNRERRGTIQYGGKLADNVHYRAYVTAFDVDDDDLTGTGAKARDSWHKVQGGFRLDWDAAQDLVTVQGDIYDGSEQQLTNADQSISGHNVLARWTHPLGYGSSVQAQAYYDHVQFAVPGRFSNHLDTYDLQGQYNVTLGRHEIVTGGGYRAMKDDFPTIISATQIVSFVPPSRTLTLWNVFVQDSIALTGKLKLIAGLKLEREPYTGLEPMPSIRLAWTISDSALLWAAASRAIRVPSRLDRDIKQGVGSTVTLLGGTMQPVKVDAYEIGYRGQPLADLSLSLSAFYNVYPNLRSAEFTNGRLPLMFANRMEGETYGVEFWANYHMLEWWRLTFGANWLHKDLRFKQGSGRFGGLQIAGDDPKYQLSLRSAMNITSNVALDLDLRRIGALPAPASPAYTELGARLGWSVTDRLELSLTGANLLHRHHAELGTVSSRLQVGPVGTRIGRSVLVGARQTF